MKLARNFLCVALASVSLWVGCGGPIQEDVQVPDARPPAAAPAGQEQEGPGTNACPDPVYCWCRNYCYDQCGSASGPCFEACMADCV